jgi:hypothetical protein
LPSVSSGCLIRSARTTLKSGTFAYPPATLFLMGILARIRLPRSRATLASQAGPARSPVLPPPIPAPLQQRVQLDAVDFQDRLEIRGESHHLPELRVLMRRSESWVAALIREPLNEYDPNAIAVEIDGTTVGYVAREQAEELAPQLDILRSRGLVVELPVQLCGGDEGRPNIGVFPDD